MKVRIEIENGKQLTEVVGHPMELLLELTCFFAKQDDIRHLLKHAIKLGEIAAKDIKDGKGNTIFNSSDRSEGSKIIDEFMKRYKTDKFDVNKN
jgi:hypothetical protein